MQAHDSDADSHDGGTIYTSSRGQGPVVVFCHGVTLASRVWAKQFASFPAAGFRAVAFDSRGHGESRTGSTGHSLDNLADDLRTVLGGVVQRAQDDVGRALGTARGAAEGADRDDARLGRAAHQPGMRHDRSGNAGAVDVRAFSGSVGAVLPVP